MLLYFISINIERDKHEVPVTVVTIFSDIPKRLQDIDLALFYT